VKERKKERKKETMTERKEVSSMHLSPLPWYSLPAQLHKLHTQQHYNTIYHTTHSTPPHSAHSSVLFF
jgi:hypothetical protein